jgi:spore maturation protein CgeB
VHTQLTWVFLGLSVTSSWGNGHATTYRALLAAIKERGHRIIFLERAVPWYRDNADMPAPPFCETILYESLPELYQQHHALVESADVCIVGSYVPDGSQVAEFVTRVCRGITAFYDIDTPITIRNLADDSCSYLKVANIPEFDVYLSFTGGPVLTQLCAEFGARRAEALYCSADPKIYYPIPNPLHWTLGYLGTYSDDRQPVVEQLLCETARKLPDERFVVAGPQYPEGLQWPVNVERVTHVSPQKHREFYSAQRATLNITRSDLVLAGFSPSVRLFEAAACGVPTISDAWPGLETVFVPGEELLVANDSTDVIRHLTTLTAERRHQLGSRARARVLGEHTASHRAASLERLILQLRAQSQVQRSKVRTRSLATSVPPVLTEAGK